MDSSNNCQRRSRNFRQPNADQHREYNNGSVSSLTSPNPQFGQGGRKQDFGFHIPVHKMNRIKQALEIVYQKREEETDWQDCIKCGLITQRKCAACGAPYCSRECQLEDWGRHARQCAAFQECEVVPTQNLNFSHCVQSQSYARNNNYNRQLNFDTNAELTRISHSDGWQQRSSESGQSRPQFNRYQSRDNNRVENNYQKDSDSNQRASKNQNRRNAGDNSQRNSNRNDASQLNNPLPCTEEDCWDTPNDPERGRMNKDSNKELHNESQKSFDQSQNEDRKKLNKESDCKPASKHQKDTTKENEWGKPEGAKKNEEIKKELVDDSSPSCNSEQVKDQKEANQSANQENVIIKKLEKFESRIVVGVTKDSDSSYYVCTPADFEAFDTLYNSLQEECPSAKSVEPRLGMVCACLAEAEWYRGKIITFQPQITFQAIDFGPTWPCDDVKEPLKELSEELAQGPGMARLLKFTEKLPSDSQDLDGESILVEILEKCDEYDVARFVKKIIPEAAEENVIEAAKDNVAEAPTVELHFREDVIESGSTVIISSSIDFDACYVQRFDNAQKLQEIGEKVNEYAKTGKPFQNEGTLKIGDVVCVQFIDDACFYRAIIESKIANSFNVRFVDYGNVQNKTELQHMMELPEELKSHPHLAVKVNLKKVTANINLIKGGKEYQQVAQYLDGLSCNSVQLILTYQEDIKNGVTLTEIATGNVVNEEINKKLNVK